MAAVTGTEQRRNSVRGRPFQKGQSGNPGGRPRLSADVREALDAALPEAVAVLARNLKDSDPRVRHVAAVAILDRALGRPSPQGESVALELPQIVTPDGVTKAAAAVLQAVAEGKITVSVGRDLVSIIDAQRRSMELIDIDQRLTALETARGLSQ